MKNELDAEDLNLIELAQNYSDEDRARALLESIRWPDGPVCPHCGHNEIYALTPLKASKTPGRKGLYCCAACRKQFTVKVGTIFEDSHLPVSKWLMAIFILCSAKKSISAHQMHRMLKVTYKTAWFMCHRIRYAMAPGQDDTAKLTGTVEADETFVGGKGELKTKYLRHTPVVALVQRGGDVRTAIVPTITHKTISSTLKQCVDTKAILNTDEATQYKVVGKEFKRHDSVNHSADEYARTLPDGSKAHINSAESFFSLLKRGVYGSWHHVSREHLHRYANEFAFRVSHNKITDGERMVKALGRIEGKRLTYRETR